MFQTPANFLNNFCKMLTVYSIEIGIKTGYICDRNDNSKSPTHNIWKPLGSLAWRDFRLLVREHSGAM